MSPAFAVLASDLGYQFSVGSDQLSFVVLCETSWAKVENESTNAVPTMTKYCAIFITK